MRGSRKYPYPPQKIVWFEPPTPLEFSVRASYFTFKILALETPLPLGICNDLGTTQSVCITHISFISEHATKIDTRLI